jgi:hypothetical protein
VGDEQDADRLAKLDQFDLMFEAKERREMHNNSLKKGFT